MLQAVLFDLDGVVFDSFEANIALYDHLMAAVGEKPAARAKAELVHSLDMVGSLHALLGHGDKFDQAMDYWRELDYRPFVARLQLFPGIRESLERLRPHYRLAVATNRRSTAQMSLEQFGLLDFFETVVTPDVVGCSKPDPRFMDFALGALGLAADEVIYLGDSEVDEQLCLASGVRLVAYRDPGLRAWRHIAEHHQLHEILAEI